ncbi:hypothetical protein [Terasakiella pusilla]|uniref:hypothetical protein n=1 Tax=Terasakiella pusilla TaxID=64973 RepID=UPI003AA7B654
MGDKYTSEGDNSQDIPRKSVNNNCLEDRDECHPVLVHAYRKTIWKFPLSVNQIFSLGCVLALLHLLGVLSIIYYPKLKAVPEWLMSVLFNMTMPAMLLGGFVLVLGVGLKAATSPFGFSFLGHFEKSEDGELYFIRMGGKCHVCSGPMKMVNALEESPVNHRLVCTRDPAHDTVFDVTSLEDVAAEYLARKKQEK